jgi:hypothetical protein
MWKSQNQTELFILRPNFICFTSSSWCEVFRADTVVSITKLFIRSGVYLEASGTATGTEAVLMSAAES